MTFQRARSEEQRDQRRRAILDTTAAMLAEMPVADVALNEISRRVGLAKSNVMRYFESREAILLDLLDTELRGWVADLEHTLPTVNGTAQGRGDALAATLATSMSTRPVLCDLISAQAAVLERNISTEVALRHKRATAVSAQLLVGLVTRVLPELGPDEGYEVVVVTLLMASAAWPHSQPSEALQAAYAADPSVAATHMTFADVVRRTLELTISGLLARQPAERPAPAVST
ncbi:TetR/AcrR family transcriptional regulator (plasmid) [Deinococcus wulumuqiensis]|uniref:TetR/AcrR family transcriptional regulator n=1 Tax=Deinococcus wulumuqiensis TaxID=980427 RepID=A0A345IMT8_9DEIO|nr:TetR/AcrR family transcriptional regulator [Deinococcus wulumuqiensis]AXH01011.1 TetR/AcrR family transcriptional regulator [Deinococcus wulumuqiensis]